MTEQAKVPAIRFAGFTDPWEQRELGELVDNIDTGRSVFCSESYGRYPVLGSTSVIGSDSSYDYEGAFLLTARVGANAGNLYRFAGKVKISDNTVFLQAPNSDFLFYLLGHFDLRKLSFGTGQPLVRASELRAVEIDVPKLENEQKSIAEFFDHLDSLITLHQRKYDKLVVFKKSMLEKMFPKDGESVPEIRFAGFTDPWEQRKFVDFVEASGIRNKDNLQLESYSVSNDRGFVPQDEQFENGGTMRDADKTAYWIVEPGSFAYNPARINVGSIGYQSTRKNVIVSSLYEVFKTDRSCDDRFLWHWFKSSLFTKQIEMLQEGGVRLYFFFDKLQKSEIWMPNVDEQRIIGQQFDQLDSLITLHQRKLELLQNIKKSLLDKMFV